MKLESRIFSIVVLSILILYPLQGWSETKSEVSVGAFAVLEGEIMDVERLKAPHQGAMVIVRDLITGKRIKFFAHPLRTTVIEAGRVTSIEDVLGGSKATLIYRESEGEDTPELVYLKAAGSYSAKVS